MKNNKKEIKAFDCMWAPWRMEYIRTPKEKRIDGCVFCHRAKENNDEEHLILYRGESAFIIMNLYPYNNGHLMIVPYRHISEYTMLTKEERYEICDLTIMTLNVLKQTMHPNGFNTGFNLGESAGAGIAEHIHQHIVPRWNGDTNFMPILGHTKVIVDGLHETWKCLKEAFDNYK